MLFALAVHAQTNETAYRAIRSVPNLSSDTKIMVHYMPWFATKSYSRTIPRPEYPPGGHWWHWEMGWINPENVDEETGRRQIASHFYPLIGPYDSYDPDLMEYHVLLMKLAGIMATLREDTCKALKANFTLCAENPLYRIFPASLASQITPNISQRQSCSKATAV